MSQLKVGPAGAAAGEGRCAPLRLLAFHSYSGGQGSFLGLTVSDI